MKYFPIKIHITYIIFTLLFSFYGPKIYRNFDKVSVLIYMFFYLIIVIFGFYLGVNSKLTVKNKNEQTLKIINDKTIKFTRISIIATLILYIVYIFYLVATKRLSFSLSAIGANYSNYYEYYKEKTSESIFTFEILFLVIAAIPKFLALVLGFNNYGELSKRYKYILLLLVFLIISSQTLSNGNQKSLGDIAIFALVALIIKAHKMSQVYRRKLFRQGAIILVVLFSIFCFAQYSRLSSRDLGAADINYKMADYSHYDLNHPIFKIFGPNVGLGIATFTTGYLSDGYYGLSLCLGLPFEWTYGIGNSVALSTIAEHMFDVDIYNRTYLARMEKVYDVPGKKHWHTIFPWLASDFTFIGALFLFLPISYIYGRCWKEIRLYRNPFSILLFSLLTVALLFITANNQIMHGFDYFLITITIFSAWKLKHKKYNIKSL